jgi:hypothetical protein
VPQWLSIALGVVVGFVVVGGVIWFILLSEESRKRRRRKSWLPEPSGRGDTWQGSGKLPMREGNMSHDATDGD